MIYPSGPGSTYVERVDLKFTFASPVNVIAYDCPAATPDVCSSTVVNSGA